MLNRRDIVYVYDGSFYGLLCAIFECYYNHEYPADIKEDLNLQAQLFCDYFHVRTDNEKAERVIRSILSKISAKALYCIYCVYLSHIDGKEMQIFDFLAAGYRFGASVINRMNLDCVANVVNTAQTISAEAEKYLGFVRFKKLKDGIYYSEIEPKNRILHIISNHFCKRFQSMPFLINDLTHKECIFYNGKSSEIYEVNSSPSLEYCDDEQSFSDMWKEFYDTIEIKERHNEKCRMSHMPKRYWKYMTEFI